MKLGEILSGPETWIKETYLDSKGRYCLVGALFRREWGNGFKLSEYARLQKVIGQLFPGETSSQWSLTTWNDDPARTWEEVAQVVEAYDRDCLLNP